VQSSSQELVGGKKRSIEGAQIERPKASRGNKWGGSVTLPSRLGGLGSVVSSHCGVWGRAAAKKTVLVHIKRRRTPVVLWRLLQITEKSSQKNRRILLTGCVYIRILRTLYGYTTW